MIQLFQDLSSVSVEAPSSLIHFLSRISSLLNKSSTQPLKKVSFMTYELQAKCKGLSEDDRFHILNDYFFYQQKFQANQQRSSELWDINYVIKNKKGSPQVIASIYIHLATSIDLPFYLTQLQKFNVIKWVQNNQSKYIYLSEKGSLLDGKKILEILNENSSSTPQENETYLNTQLEIVPTKKLLLQYVENLCEIYKNEEKDLQYKTMLDVSLILSPSNLNFLSQRALLLKQTDNHKKALMDFKKYVSFTPSTESSEQLKRAICWDKPKELENKHPEYTNPSDKDQEPSSTPHTIPKHINSNVSKESEPTKYDES